MKTILVEKAGNPDVLTLTERPIPEIKDGLSLIKVKGFGINHSEIFTRQGLSPSVEFPRILGIECVGEIVETTDDVKLPLGQKIVSIMGEMGRAFDGSYAEYVLLPNDQIYPVETDMDWVTLATIPETYYTAYGSLKNLQLKDAQTILVRGGSSGVGTAFAKLLKGIFPENRLVASVRGLDKTNQLKAVGFDDIILDQNNQLQTDESFDRILELIGPASVKDSLQHLNDDGIVCSCGQLGGQWYLNDFDPIMELQKNVYLTTFYSGNVSLEKMQELLDTIQKYEIDIKPDRIFSLENVADAHRYLESGQAFGKVIVLTEGVENVG